jgi:hypothetical protein
VDLEVVVYYLGRRVGETGAGRGARLAEDVEIDSVDRDEFNGLRMKPQPSVCRYPWVRWPPFIEKGKIELFDACWLCG